MQMVAHASESGRASSANASHGLAFFPPRFKNGYIPLLYDHLSRLGFSVEDDGIFKLSWLRQARRRIDVIHFNWPQAYYVSSRRPERFAPYFSSWTLTRFTGRLIAARLLGYRIVWTVHQVHPHESISRRLDRAAGFVLARLSHALVAHDAATRTAVRAELGRRAERKVRVIPHGSYVGFYPPGRSRDAVRGELGIGSATFVFLAFGTLRRYKDLDVLFDAFTRASLEDAALVVAGWAMDPGVASVVRDAAAANERIKIYKDLDYVPRERVHELFSACDVAVVSRGDGGTSGALMLALSMGRPAIGADQPAYAELIARHGCGWTFSPHGASSLARVLEVAASDRSVAREKGVAALAVAQSRRWPDLAREMGEVLAGQSRPWAKC